MSPKSKVTVEGGADLTAEEGRPPLDVLRLVPTLQRFDGTVNTVPKSEFDHRSLPDRVAWRPRNIRGYQKPSDAKGHSGPRSCGGQPDLCLHVDGVVGVWSFAKFDDIDHDAGIGLD
jgi:hypothetical protein